MPAIYDQSVAKQFVSAVQSNSSRLAESFAKIITNIRSTQPTDDQISIANGTGVSKDQQASDLTTAKQLGQHLLEISKLISLAEQNARSTNVAGGKYKFEMDNVSSVVNMLSRLSDFVNKLDEHKKAYKISSVFDSKVGVHAGKRFRNLADILSSFADGDEKAMLAAMKKKAHLDICERLILLARQCNRRMLVKEALHLRKIASKLETI